MIDTYDIFHGFDIDKMKNDLVEIENTINQAEDLISKSDNEDRKNHLKIFVNRCKLMRYRIKHRIDILEETKNS